MPEDRAPSTKYFRPASVERVVVAVEGGDHVERQADAARGRDRGAIRSLAEITIIMPMVESSDQDRVLEAARCLSRRM